jgi:outer membrane protein OmpA-like peptidoglycan-associated protein
MPEPPCFARCTTSLLALASFSDLADFFHLDKDTANAVLRARERISSPDEDLLALLTSEQRDSVVAAIGAKGDGDLRGYVEQIRMTGATIEDRQAFLRELAFEGKVSRTAQEALRRAQEAGKLAEGKLLYESVLTDDKVKFGFDVAELSPEAKSALDAFANQLVQEGSSVYIEIQGHTDATGSEEYNEQLGLERAEAVRRYLSQQHRFPLHRMNVISYGETAAIAANDSREGRASNRRIALVVLQ